MILLKQEQFIISKFRNISCPEQGYIPLEKVKLKNYKELNIINNLI